MKSKKFFYLFVFFISISLQAQVNESVEKAIRFGDSLQYLDAINLLKTEIKNNPNNADAYYWLGRYSHYLVYDSRPFTQKGDEWSKQQVLFNFKKAIELNPKMGDAYYFLAVEYGCRAREAIENNNILQAKKELTEAAKLGAFPNYILEYARNILSVCEKNAILFSNTDAPINAFMYVQLVENFRKDISVVCVNLLNFPFFVKYMRDGIPNEIAKIPISWNNDLIMHMQDNFAWKAQNIPIKISSNQRHIYNLPDSVEEINMFIKNKYQGYYIMWIGTAAILNILENNKFERPIYCALPRDDDNFEFYDYLQNEGFVSKFMPYKVENSDKYNKEKFESTVLNADYYKDFGDVKEHNQPRAGNFFVNDRRNGILDYIDFLLSSNKKQDAQKVYDKMNLLMPTLFAPLTKELEERCEKIEKYLKN
jgi:hypothetical protein